MTPLSCEFCGHDSARWCRSPLLEMGIALCSYCEAKWRGVYLIPIRHDDVSLPSEGLAGGHHNQPLTWRADANQ